MREDKKILTKHALQPGTVVAGAGRTYTIVRTLGTGGFGITYLADDDLGNRIVIKEFFLKGCWRGTDGITVEHAPTIDEDFETGRTDFVEEARRLGILGRNSPNIVTVYSTFEALGTAYYTMEYIDGGDLRSYVEEHGPMPEQQAVETILTVASAVGMLHASHVLHLDIKPGNIVLRHGSDGKLEPVLIDFGIAKHFGSDGSPTTYLTAKGASSGYAPIEQYDDIDTFSPQIDIYALGGTLYYLLTGKNPPKAFDIKSFDELRGNLPEGLGENTVAVLKGAMKHIKHERLQTIDTFMSLLCGHTVHNNATEVLLDRKGKRKSKGSIIFVFLFLVLVIVNSFIDKEYTEISTRAIHNSIRDDIDNVFMMANLKKRYKDSLLTKIVLENLPLIEPFEVKKDVPTQGKSLDFENDDSITSTLVKGLTKEESDSIRRDSIIKSRQDKWSRDVGDIKICELRNADDSAGGLMTNFINEFLYTRGQQLADSEIDCTISSRGLQRTNWTNGEITVMDVYNMMPFNNIVVVLEVEADDLVDVREILRLQAGEIDNRLNTLDIIPGETYRVATIDYIAKGGDYMTPLLNARLIAKSNNSIQKDFINFIYNLSKTNLDLNNYK